MLQGIFTTLCLLGFIAIVIWAYGNKQKTRFEDAAQLPLADDDLSTQASKRREP